MRTDEEASRIWFTADIHWLHPKIVTICNRPTTIEKHDEWLLARINSVVGKNDYFYILGDVSMGNREKTEKLLARMHGHKILIQGNHDKSIESSTMFKERVQIKDFTFDSPSYPNVHLVLCHYPMRSWNRAVHGSGMLFGHVHGRLRPGFFKRLLYKLRILKQSKTFDVGVDANDYLPLNLVQVLDKLTKISLDLF